MSVNSPADRCNNITMICITISASGAPLRTTAKDGRLAGRGKSRDRD